MIPKMSLYIVLWLDKLSTVLVLVGFVMELGLYNGDVAHPAGGLSGALQLYHSSRTDNSFPFFETKFGSDSTSSSFTHEACSSSPS